MESSAAVIPLYHQRYFLFPSKPTKKIKAYTCCPYSNKPRASQLPTRLRCQKMFVPGGSLSFSSLIFFLPFKKWLSRWFHSYEFKGLEKHRQKQRQQNNCIISSIMLRLTSLLPNLRFSSSLLIFKFILFYYYYLKIP